MARAQAAGMPCRNFQGDTAEAADALIGFGASAMGTMPERDVQNQTDIGAWKRTVRAGDLATAKDVEANREDAGDLECGGLVARDASTLSVNEAARPLLRTVCALFDAHVAPTQGERRHALAGRAGRMKPLRDSGRARSSTL